MSDYQRFVSYFYEYHLNEKLQNRGFVRTEIKDGQCSLEIHLKIPPCPFIPVFQAYCFIPEKDHLTGIPLGSLSYDQGSVYGRLGISNSYLSSIGYSLSRLEGILIQADTGQVFATGWSDLPVLPETFVPWTEKSAVSVKAAESAPGKPAPEEKAPPVLKAMPDHWKEIQDTYPHFHPFFDDEIHHCVKLSTKDIPSLTRYGYFIGNNQFLTHSCLIYKHILLGQLNRKDSQEHVLAIPGCYDEKERLIAAMFGFPYFKPSRHPMIRPGQFGYWYRILC